MQTDSCKPLRLLRPILMPLLGIALSAIVTGDCGKNPLASMTPVRSVCARKPLT